MQEKSDVQNVVDSLYRLYYPGESLPDLNSAGSFQKVLPALDDTLDHEMTQLWLALMLVNKKTFYSDYSSTKEEQRLINAAKTYYSLRKTYAEALDNLDHYQIHLSLSFEREKRRIELHGFGFNYQDKLFHNVPSLMRAVVLNKELSVPENLRPTLESFWNIDGTLTEAKYVMGKELDHDAVDLLWKMGLVRGGGTSIPSQLSLAEFKKKDYRARNPEEKSIIGNEFFSTFFRSLYRDRGGSSNYYFEEYAPLVQALFTR